MIKIAIAGCHGTGKSTLINNMIEEFDQYGLQVYRVNEAARECPIKLGSIDFQKWVWEAHIKKELDGHNSKCDIILCDRTLMDNLIYYKYLLNDKPDPIFEALTDYTQKWMGTYNYISVLDMNPEFIVDDGFRITDMNKTIEINKLFIKYLKPYQNIDINRFNYKEIIRELI